VVLKFVDTYLNHLQLSADFLPTSKHSECFLTTIFCSRMQMLTERLQCNEKCYMIVLASFHEAWQEDVKFNHT